MLNKEDGFSRVEGNEDIPVHVAFGKQPRDVVPGGRVAERGHLLVVLGDLVGEAIVDNGCQGLVVLNLVLEGAELLDNLLALSLLLSVVGLGDALVDVVHSASLDCKVSFDTVDPIELVNMPE